MPGYFTVSQLIIILFYLRIYAGIRYSRAAKYGYPLEHNSIEITYVNAYFKYAFASCRRRRRRVTFVVPKWRMHCLTPAPISEQVRLDLMQSLQGKCDGTMLGQSAYVSVYICVCV